MAVSMSARTDWKKVRAELYADDAPFLRPLQAFQSALSGY
jgi:hypothetical protein